LTLISSIYPRLAEGDIDDIINSWNLVLLDIDYATAKTAVVKMIRSDEYPSPGKIIKAVRSIRNAGIPSAEEAWSEVIKKLDPYKRPEWSHDLIGDAVRCMGYVELCRSENPGMDRAQFLKIYNNLLDRQADRQENEVVYQITRQTVMKLAKGIG